MAHDTSSLPAREWTQISSTAVDRIRVQNLSGCAVSLMATATASAPVGMAGALDILPYDILAGDTPIADLWLDLSAGYVWARAETGGAVSVSHA